MFREQVPIFEAAIGENLSATLKAILKKGVFPIIVDHGILKDRYGKEKINSRGEIAFIAEKEIAIIRDKLRILIQESEEIEASDLLRKVEFCADQLENWIEVKTLASI